MRNLQLHKGEWQVFAVQDYFHKYNNFFFLEFYVKEEDLYLLDDFPSEDSLQIYFDLYESRYGNIISRLKFHINYEYLEDFIFHLYQLIEDIPYIDEITSSSLIEWMIDYDLDSRRYSNKDWFEDF